MKSHKLSLLPVILCLYFCGCLQSGSGGLELYISLPKEKYAKNEEVAVKVTAMNRSKSPYILHLQFRAPSLLIWEIKDLKGGEVRFNKEYIVGIDPKSYRVLLPGATYTENACLTSDGCNNPKERLLEFKKSGQYIIRAFYGANYEDYRQSVLPMNWYQRLKYKVWVGSVESNTVQFEIE